MLLKSTPLGTRKQASHFWLARAVDHSLALAPLPVAIEFLLLLVSFPIQMGRWTQSANLHKSKYSSLKSSARFFKHRNRFQNNQ